MLLILVEVSVKVACQSTTAIDCRHRAISMLLILMEVSVKVACQSTTATDCSHRASQSESINERGFSVMIGTDCSHRVMYLLLILVEVSVKVACRSTISTDCSH